MLVDANKLMGAAEIRAALGVGKTRLRELQRRPDFPRPIRHLTGMKIWDGVAVEAWIAVHRKPADEDDTEG